MKLICKKIFIPFGYIFVGIAIALFFCWFFYGDLLKYLKIEKTLSSVNKKQYNESLYNCINFSQDTVEKLKKENISSNVIVIKDPNEDNTHAVISIWIDPQTGDFVNNYQYLGNYKELKNLYGWADR